MADPKQPAFLDRALIFLCSARTRELVLDIWTNPSRWRIDLDGTVLRERPYPAEYSPARKRVYFANGWGRSYWLFPTERLAFRRAAKAMLAEKDRRDDRG